jgi:hypothetical protein
MYTITVTLMPEDLQRRSAGDRVVSGRRRDDEESSGVLMRKSR